jgi:hypothetical protein
MLKPCWCHGGFDGKRLEQVKNLWRILMAVTLVTGVLLHSLLLLHFINYQFKVLGDIRYNFATAEPAHNLKLRSV